MGATLYRMITGKLPPSAQYMNEHGELPDPGVFISEETFDAITNAMKVQPSQRPGSVQELMEILSGKRKRKNYLDNLDNISNKYNGPYRPPLPQTGSEKIKRYEAKKAAEKIKIDNKSEVLIRIFSFIVRIIEVIFVLIIILVVLLILTYYLFPYLASRNEGADYETVQNNIIDFGVKFGNVVMEYFR